MTKYSSVKPGEIWFDTKGEPIQAHMPRLFFENGIYYWYGMDKSNTTGNTKVWQWGVRCYKSCDLYNWEDLGHIIPPVTEDEEHPLSPVKELDRPHIIQSPFTKKYVCWFDGCSNGLATVLISDNFLGPYSIVHPGLSPLDMGMGDFDLVSAPDGKGYCYFNRKHTELICADLTRDYCNVTGYYSTHFPATLPPYTREAPAHFYRKRKHYLITSGTTAYYPNPSSVAVAESWHGPFRVLGNPHRHDSSNTSFHSQISQVFKVPDKEDLYIALADRWLPDNMDVSYEDVAALYNHWFNPEAPKPKKQIELPSCTEANVSIARYVWLPLVFEDEMVYIDWQSEWRLEDY